MPMKIDNMTTKGPSISLSRTSEEERIRDIDTDFSTELRNQEESVTTEQLDKLLKQIDEQGARLSKTPT